MPASLPANASQRRRVARTIDNPDTLFPIPAFKMRWTILLLVLASARGQDTCLSSNEDPYLLFGTKTTYNFVNRNIAKRNPQNIPGCQPAAIWLLNRHGATNPEADELLELQRLVELRNSVLSNYKNGYYKEPKVCPADLTLLNRWTWNPRHNLTFAGDLTMAGYLETQELARGWRTRYPALLTDNKHDYLFKFAKDKLSSESFRAFTEGLFRSQAEHIDLPQENDEELLKPDKFCPSWSTNVGDNNETLRQRDIFESKHEWQDMVSNISSRLGFTYDVDRSLIKRIYQMCRYYKAWEITQISPWCSVFSREDLRRFEYAEDLETFYKYGYGSEISPQLACPLIKDMMNFFYKHANASKYGCVASSTRKTETFYKYGYGSEISPHLACPLIKDMMNFFYKHANAKDAQQPCSQVLFTEAAPLLILTGAIGARRDEAPPTGDNYHTTAAQSRHWASSSTAPFNGNLAAVLYKCNPNGNFGYKNRHQVLFLQNEQPMTLDWCKVGLCEWPDVKDKLGEIAEKCNMDFCSGAPSVNSLTAFSVGLVAFFVRYLV